MWCIIVSFLLLHILPTAYPIPRSQLLRNPVILNLFSPCTAYRLASYIRYTTTLNLLFPSTALRVPRSQPISLTHSMWRRILQLLKAEWNGTIHFSISNTLKRRVLSNVKGKSSKLCLFWLVLYIDRHGSSWGLYRRVLVMGDELILFSVKRKFTEKILRDPWRSRILKRHSWFYLSILRNFETQFLRMVRAIYREWLRYEICNVEPWHSHVQFFCRQKLFLVYETSH